MQRQTKDIVKDIVKGFVKGFINGAGFGAMIIYPCMMIASGLHGNGTFSYRTVPSSFFITMIIGTLVGIIASKWRTK